MAIKLADTLAPMSEFPAAMAEHIGFSDGATLQEKFDNKELGGGDSSVTLTQEEYEALPEEEKLDGLYYTYDTKRIYKNGVQYGASEPIPLTMEEYKTLKEAGAIDEKQEYLVEADAEGIFLGAEDIGYSNAESGIQATTVQGAIDKVAEKVDSEIAEIKTEVESVYTTDSIANTLYYACEYFELDCRNQYQVLEIEVIDVKGKNLKFNSIYKHEVLHHAQVISENGITLKAIDTVGTLAFENASDYTIKVKHIDICPDSIGDTLVTVINRANKNALASDITSTYLIKDIAAGGDNEKTFSFKIRKDYFASYYAKRTFLLSANIYSLGFSKPVICLVEIFRGSADNYNGYIVNLQDTRFTGITVTVNGDYLEVVVTLNSYESSGCMVSCSSLSNIPIA